MRDAILSTLSLIPVWRVRVVAPHGMLSWRERHSSQSASIFLWLLPSVQGISHTLPTTERILLPSYLPTATVAVPEGRTTWHTYRGGDVIALNQLLFSFGYHLLYKKHPMPSSPQRSHRSNHLAVSPTFAPSKFTHVSAMLSCHTSTGSLLSMPEKAWHSLTVV